MNVMAIWLVHRVLVVQSGTHLAVETMASSGQAVTTPALQDPGNQVATWLPFTLQ